jgi:hypothetical protein
MHSLDEVRIACEGLARDRLIAPEEPRDIVLLHSQRREWAPGQRVFQVTPDPLTGVQLGAIGRQADEADGFREGELLGRMGATIIPQQEMQTVRQGLREQVGENREMLRVQIRPFQEESVARGRLHRPIHIAPREDLWDGSHRLHAAGGEAPAANRQAAEAAFVRAEDPERARVGGRDGLLQVGRDRSPGRPPWRQGFLV